VGVTGVARIGELHGLEQHVLHTHIAGDLFRLCHLFRCVGFAEAAGGHAAVSQLIVGNSQEQCAVHTTRVGNHDRIKRPQDVAKCIEFVTRGQVDGGLQGFDHGDSGSGTVRRCNRSYHRWMVSSPGTMYDGRAVETDGSNLLCRHFVLRRNHFPEVPFS
jgi:hypothetical protein